MTPADCTVGIDNLFHVSTEFYSAQYINRLSSGTTGVIRNLDKVAAFAKAIKSI